MKKKLVDVVVESLYAQAMEKRTTFSSEGGLPVEDRWWNAIEEAYKQGIEDCEAGLHE